MYGGSLYDEAIRYGEMASYWSKSQPHQVIHAHDWMTYPAALQARGVSGKPVVAHIHATEYDRTGGRVNSLIAEMEYEGLNKADRVIAVSEYTKRTVERYYGVPSERIVVVHNGVDLQEFEPLKIKKLFPKDKVVLFVGRLTYQKGVSYFLQAAKKVLVTEPNSIFLVVGHGDMYESLMMEAASLGIGNRVVFGGFLGGDKLRSCYQMADVFVMPSVSEPYGIVALEALAAGTPAVISNQSGVSEALKNVCKVDFWNTTEMAELISGLLADPKLAQKMANKAKAEVAKQTWESAAQKTMQVYRDLV